jgi:hypothetical protein
MPSLKQTVIKKNPLFVVPHLVGGVGHHVLPEDGVLNAETYRSDICSIYM